MVASLQQNKKREETVQYQLCYHCGLPLDEINASELVILEEEDKAFCCEGCRMVYEILSENGLCKFYEINENAGVRLRGKKQEKYAWLDDREVVEKLIDFTDGEIEKTTFYLPDIHCASCLWLIENLYKLSPGILASKINFLKKKAFITYKKDAISLRKVVELLASLGYAPELNLNTLEEKKSKPVSKRLIYQLGVAGFSFGNIMLLSFPEYLGLDAKEVWFRNLFGYLNIFLALPVVFYSGRDYLTSAWQSIRNWRPGIDIPLALGITVLFLRSVFEIVTGAGAGYLDSLAGLVFFLLIGKWFQQLTYHRISFERDYKSYFPVAANRIIQNSNDSAKEEENIAINKLVPGDVIIIRNKELIPADGVLLNGKAAIDYSFVTGESNPASVEVNEKVYAGGRQIGAAIEVLITRKVSQSYLTQLWNDEAFKTKTEESASQLADKIGRYFTIVVLTIAVLTLGYWYNTDTKLAINAFTAVLIIACPCAAALNIPFTLGNALRILSSHGFYLKNTNVIERLQKISTVIFDKTGTLTHGSGSEINFSGNPLSNWEKCLVAALSSQSTHPLSRQITDFLQAYRNKVDLDDFQEITGKGLYGKRSDTVIKLGSKDFVVGTSREGDGDSEKGNVFISINGETKGWFKVNNKYRKAAWDLLAWFDRTKTYLLSGDNDQEFDFLADKFHDPKEQLRFQQSPKDKLGFVKQQQKEGEIVMMLGDGLNDAGALKQAEVGVVVSENTNNFTPACDAILDARKFSQLPKYFNYLQDSIKVVYAAWGLAVIYNIIGLGFAVQGLLSPVVAAILMPASSLTIVVFGVGLSSWLAKRQLGTVNEKNS